MALQARLQVVDTVVGTGREAKDGDVFLVTNQNGNVPMKGPHGFGLYYHDCRFLDGYLLRLQSGLDRG